MSGHGKALSMPAHTLHVYTPPATSPRDRRQADLSPTMSLSAVFAAYVRPVCLLPSGACESTINQYAESLGYWATFTGDPPLLEVDDYAAADFVAGLMRLPGRKSPTISPNTVRKHCRHVQYILDRCGPRTRHLRQAAGLIPEVPYLAAPKKRPKPTVEAFVLAEIRAWLNACSTATRPQIPGVMPPPWWRALIVAGYNTGLRIGSLLALQRQWLTVTDDGSGWVVIPSHAVKGNRSRHVYCSPAAVAAMRSIPTRGHIFPWPQSVRQLQRYRQRLLIAAHLPPERQFGFHGLRRALGTELFRINAGAARAQLGHADERTTREYYVTADAVAPALAAVPQP